MNNLVSFFSFPFFVSTPALHVVFWSMCVYYTSNGDGIIIPQSERARILRLIAACALERFICLCVRVLSGKARANCIACACALIWTMMTTTTSKYRVWQQHAWTTLYTIMSPQDHHRTTDFWIECVYFLSGTMFLPHTQMGFDLRLFLPPPSRISSSLSASGCVAATASHFN